MHVKIEVTEQLRALMNRTFITKDAMKLIRSGAAPNVRDNFGDSFLHILTQDGNNINGCNGSSIEELVTQHHVHIDTQNTRGQETG